MDAVGAQHLAARLRAGVRVGATIRLDDAVGDSDLVAGDVGVVKEITTDGVIVRWERGFTLSIEPQAVSFHALS
jgi:hypothetical protein